MSGTAKSPLDTVNNSGQESLASSGDDWTKGVDVPPWEELPLMLQGGIVDLPTSGSDDRDDRKMIGLSYQKAGSTDQLVSVLEETKKPAGISTETMDSGQDKEYVAKSTPEHTPRTKPPDKGRPRKRSKRAKGTPKRPLTAYNLFFRDRREVLMSGEHRLSFQELGKVIGREWHDLTPSVRHQYDCLAKIETDRYHREMDIYLECKRKDRDAELQGEALMAGTVNATIDANHASMDNAQVLPPGGEVMIPGPDGVLRPYRVEYKAVRMKQSDFDEGKWHSLMQQPGNRKQPPSKG